MFPKPELLDEVAPREDDPVVDAPPMLEEPEPLLDVPDMPEEVEP
jgi:hypothetical protein